MNENSIKDNSEEINEISKEEEEEDEEEEEVEEEEEEEEEMRKKPIYNNIIIYFNELFYDTIIQKLTSKNIDLYLHEIKGTLEKGYNNNINKIKKLDNEYYYLFEITFFCIYLTFLEIYNNKKETLRQGKIKIISNAIKGFIKAYEKYSLYFNFIDDEGYKTYIKNKYIELYNYLPIKSIVFENEYKTIPELRKYLLNNKKFKIYNKDNAQYVEIIKKKVKFAENRQIKEIFGVVNENDLVLLCNREVEEFYKGEKAKEVQKFYEKFDFDNKDINQRNKYFNKFIDNYLKIVE